MKKTMKKYNKNDKPAQNQKFQDTACLTVLEPIINHMNVNLKLLHIINVRTLDV